MLKVEVSKKVFGRHLKVIISWAERLVSRIPSVPPCE